MACFLTALVLGGCTGQAIQPAVEPEPAAQDTVVRIARWPNCDLAAFQQLMQEYSESNPHGITVEVDALPWDRFVETINLQMTSGEGADILGLKSDQVYYYAGRDWILNLEGEADLSFTESYPAWTRQYQKSYQYTGGFYAIPSTQVTFRLLYNRGLLADAGYTAPPETLSQLEAAAMAISQSGVGQHRYGLGVPLGDEWAGLVAAMEAPLTRSGIHYFDYEEDLYTLGGYKDWLEMLGRLESKGLLYPGGTSLRQDITFAQFAEGNIGMVYADSSTPYLLDEKYRTVVDWDVAMPPTGGEAAGALQVAPGVCYAVNAFSAQKEAAIRVWEYLHSAEFMKKLMVAGIEIPVLDEVLRNPENLPNIRGYEAFLPGEGEAVYPVTPVEMDEHLRLGTYLVQNTGLAEVGPALEAAEQELNDYYAYKKSFPSYPYGRYTIPEFDAEKPDATWYPLA